MAPKLVIRRLRVREFVLAVALAGLLAYAYIPVTGGRRPDAVADQPRGLRAGRPLDRVNAVADLARGAGKDLTKIIPALIQALGDPDAQVRQTAVGALHALEPGDPMVEQVTGPLIQALGDSDHQVRATAAGMLSKLKPRPKETIPALVAAAKLENPAPPHAASALDETASLSPVEKSIERSQRHHARASAVSALGAIAPNDPDVEQVLISLAADPAIEVRAAVAQTLGQMGTETTTAFATEEKLASDVDMFVQSQAVSALGSFPRNYKAACPHIYRAYLSKERQLIDAAESALERITKSAVFDASSARQSQDPPVRFAATFGLNPSTEEGFRLLTSALKDQDPGVRLLAVVRLGTASGKRAAAARKVLDALAAEPDADVRAWIVNSRNLLAPPAKSAN